MAEKKGTTILLTVIGIATLLVTLVGATFAYFTATLSDSNVDNEDVVITAATLGEIVYTHSDTILLDNAYPGATDEIEFSVKSPDTATADVDYDVYLVVEDNTFTSENLTATLGTKPSSTVLAENFGTGTDVLLNTFTDNADGSEKSYLIASATLGATETDNWKLSVILKEINEAQNYDQGKVFKARVEVKVSDQGKYTQDNVYGPAQSN